MLRDEILAEWRETAAPVRSSSGGSNGSSSDGEGSGWRSAPQPSLHVYCHVSGEELWPAPPALRSFIFQVGSRVACSRQKGCAAAAIGLLTRKHSYWRVHAALDCGMRPATQLASSPAASHAQPFVLLPPLPLTPARDGACAGHHHAR